MSGALTFFYGSLTLQIFVEFLHLGHFLRDYKGWSYATLVMLTSTQPSILSLDLLLQFTDFGNFCLIFFLGHFLRKYKS